MLPKAEVNNETGIIEVSYYYEPDDITLVLSHYLVDTNEKIVEDEIITTTKTAGDRCTITRYWLWSC